MTIKSFDKVRFFFNMAPKCDSFSNDIQRVALNQFTVGGDTLLPNPICLRKDEALNFLRYTRALKDQAPVCLRAGGTELKYFTIAEIKFVK